jgi:RNA polymerase sigma-70 factor (ECF subfamily)
MTSVGLMLPSDAPDDGAKEGDALAPLADERLTSGVRPTPAHPDAEALARAHLDGGDRRAAIAVLARAHGPSLGRLCFAMLGRKEDADEAAQESLLALYDGLVDYRAEGSLRAYLFGIARRICARRIEVRTRQARRGRLLTPIDETTTPSDDDPARALECARVRDALETLRPTEREALLLRFEGELPFREVAIACGIEEPAARQRVSRALALLRTRLSDGET